MHYFLFRRNFAGCGHLSYRLHLWRAGGAPRNSVDDGTGGVGGDQYVNKKILQTRKPDSVLCYHLSGTAITCRLLLPTLQRSRLKGIGRATLNRWYTWHYSIQG